MNWFNYYGLLILVVIMVPNIVFGFKNKDTFVNHFDNKRLEILEQISRYAVFGLMIINIPFTWYGFYFENASTVYVIVNAVLVIAYVMGWILLWKKNNVIKGSLLSVIPSIIFIFSGVMLGSILLTIFSVIFAICHIKISLINSSFADQSPKKKRNAILTSLCVVVGFLAFTGVSYVVSSAMNKVTYKDITDMTTTEMLEYSATGSNKISVAIIENGETTYRVYGKNGLEDKTYDYEIGSISKTYLGLLFAKAVSENKVSLYDQISKYLELDNTKYYPTILRLLSHSSGYAADYLEPEMIIHDFSHFTCNGYYDVSKSQILAKIKSISLENKTYDFCYSNFGISVLGLVLESVYNDTFNNIMDKFITEDLGLSNTKTGVGSGNLNGYWEWKKDDGYIPAAGIISNIYDMADYLDFYLSDNTYSLNATSVLRSLGGTYDNNFNELIRIDSIGMTWFRDDFNGFNWHSGSTTNYNSYIAFNKTKQVGVVILGNLNQDDGVNLTVIGNRIMKDLVN